MPQPDTPEATGFEVTRFIPVPASISEHAQQFLALGFSMGGDIALQPSDRHDVEGWRAMIKATDEALIAATNMMPAVPASTVEKTTVGGVPVFVLTPDGVPEDPDQPTYFDIHGGALIMGGGEACRALATKIAAMVRMRAAGARRRSAASRGAGVAHTGSRSHRVR